MITRMSTESVGRIPALTLGWRLKMSLGGMSREQIAELMDVTPSTISRWMADKGAPPKRPYIVQWAMATNVDAEWLEKGVGSSEPTGPAGGPRGGRDERAAGLAKLAARKRPRHAGRPVNPEYPIAA